PLGRTVSLHGALPISRLAPRLPDTKPRMRYTVRAEPARFGGRGPLEIFIFPPDALHASGPTRSRSIPGERGAMSARAKPPFRAEDRKSTRLNSSHGSI